MPCTLCRILFTSLYLHKFAQHPAQILLRNHTWTDLFDFCSNLDNFQLDLNLCPRLLLCSLYNSSIIVRVLSCFAPRTILELSSYHCRFMNHHTFVLLLFIQFRTVTIWHLARNFLLHPLRMGYIVSVVNFWSGGSYGTGLGFVSLHCAFLVAWSQLKDKRETNVYLHGTPFILLYYVLTPVS
jgi:hypothetical protein